VPIPTKMRLPTALMLLIIFNAVDAFLTLKYIKFGALCESNPIMDYLLETNHYIFIFYKLIIVSLCAIALYRNRKIKLIPIVLYFLSFVYGLLMLWWTYVIFLLY
tara:strand:+ start:1034 stop:1348 length:315 start_codon:yes stop_codon:yes gene_type:complete